MKKVRTNAKRRQSIIDSAHSGKNNGKPISDDHLKMALSSPGLWSMWDNEDGTYSALDLNTTLDFKSIKEVKKIEKMLCPNCKTSFENFDMNICLESCVVEFFCPACGKSI